MMTKAGTVLLVSLATLAVQALAGCATPPPQPYADADELRAVVVSHTLTIPTGQSSFATQLYLAPDGTGWMDTLLAPDHPPSQVGMTAVLSWQVFDPSWVCAWTSPTLGEVPNMMPPRRQCLQVLRYPSVPNQADALYVRTERGDIAPLEISDGNAFPTPRIAAFNEQLRVLFGGAMPVWQVPPTYPPLAGN